LLPLFLEGAREEILRPPYSGLLPNFPFFFVFSFLFTLLLMGRRESGEGESQENMSSEVIVKQRNVSLPMPADVFWLS
jgi:hypothetical protein